LHARMDGGIGSASSETHENLRPGPFHSLFTAAATPSRRSAGCSTGARPSATSKPPSAAAAPASPRSRTFRTGPQGSPAAADAEEGPLHRVGAREVVERPVPLDARHLRPRPARTSFFYAVCAHISFGQFPFLFSSLLPVLLLVIVLLGFDINLYLFLNRPLFLISATQCWILLYLFSLGLKNLVTLIFPLNSRQFIVIHLTITYLLRCAIHLSW
jgi:hypothetical protein